MTTGQMAESALQNTNEQLRRFESYFTPFWVSDNPSAQTLKPSLLELVQRIQEQEQGVSKKERSNRGGWRSKTLTMNQPGLDALAPWLKQMIGQVISPKYRYQIELWLNVHHQHGFNLRHTHPGAVLSGVYYIAVPKGSGNLVIHDPRADAVFARFDDYFQYCKNERLSHGPIALKPSEGRLIMFPAWLSHHVEASNSTEERISLPFNLVAKGPVNA